MTGAVDVAPFNQDARIKALRTAQAGDSTFPEFLQSCWHADVVRYEVDFAARSVAYQGCCGKEYIEQCAAVDLAAVTAP